MDCYLIAASGWLDLGAWIAILQVAIGLGFVIFVHELGHFLVAKACGVKCEKFYLGFDIGGWKFCKFQWGETEYGIGVLPLGGYVKMLGQEDNPAKLREEMERARQKPAEDTSAEASEESDENTSENQPAVASASSAEAAGDTASDTAGDEAEKPSQPASSSVTEAEQALYDPRSFLAQSVPKRMAIISAGVIMNVIFAFVMAVVAYSLGVQQVAATVGSVEPGMAAWQGNMKVGDRLVDVAGKPIEKFRDLQEAISLGDNLDEGVSITVERPGAEEPLTFVVKPKQDGLLPRIGISNSYVPVVAGKRLPFAAWPGSAAAQAKPPFERNDRIVKIDGKPLETYTQLHAYLATHPEKTLQFTVERPSAEKNGSPEELTIDVPPNPMHRLGLVMEMGTISAVQDESPAMAAGILPGDKIVQIDGELPGDPMTLPERLARQGGQTVVLTLERAGEKGPVDVEVPLRKADWYESSWVPGSPISVPSLGVAYRVLGRVNSTIDGFPAAKAGLQNGDEIVSAKILPPPADGEAGNEKAEEQPEQTELTLKFSDEERNWPFFINFLQNALPGTTVELTWRRQDEELSATLGLKDDPTWFNPDRGLILQSEYYTQRAANLGQAIQWGGEETLNATLLVYRFIRKLGSQVSPRALGGPISIFVVAKSAAEKSFADLLIFLTLLSANLAVINFLPIPLLDGGHMILLAWEGIRGKPADERIQLVLTYIGLAFILTLMFWVLGLDLGLISRQ